MSIPESSPASRCRVELSSGLWCTQSDKTFPKSRDLITTSARRPGVQRGAITTPKTLS